MAGLGPCFCGLMRYFLHLAYDGTHYHGWQVQPNALTVQAELDRFPPWPPPATFSCFVRF